MYGERSSGNLAKNFTVVSDIDRVRWDSKVDLASVRSTTTAPILPTEVPTLDLMLSVINDQVSGYASVTYVDAADAALQAQIDVIVGGGIPDGDKGDIVVSASGATWTIDTGVVTLAKMQTVATGKLLGRMTAGTGTIELLTYTAAGQALVEAANAAAQRTALGLGTLALQSNTLSGTNTGDQTITLTGDVTGSGTGSFAATIANSVVTEAKLSLSDLTTYNVSTACHGFVPKAPNDASQFLRGDGTWSALPTTTVNDSDVVFTDITTSNASTSKHGYLRKLDGNAAHYLDGTGAWSTPGGGGSVAWGAITGTLSSQTDLQSALDAKAASGTNTDITGVTLNQTGLKVQGATSNALTIKPNETLSASRTLNIVTGDADRTLTLSGNATISGTNTGDQDLSGYVPTTRTINGNALSSNVTITLASLSGAASGANTDITSVLLSQTGLVVKGATSNALTIIPNETLTAARTLNIVTNDASRTLTIASDATISGTNTGDQTISDATVSFTDITTNNSSTSKHGFLKKLSNVATEYMDGTGAWSAPRKYANYIIPISDFTTNLTTGTAKATFRMPGAFTVTEVRAYVTTQQTAGSILQFDINESGTSILSTKLTIDNNESTSVTAATPAVISDASIADNAEITIDIDTVGTAGAKGAGVIIMGYH